MARLVVVGRTARASADFLVDDLPGTSGRLDVLVRCVRAGLLVSHGVRRDALVYLVLGGGPRAPRAVRFDGATAKFLRPDERSLAVLLRKTLTATVDPPADAPDSFVAVRPGIAVAAGGLAAALEDRGDGPLYALDESGDDIRGVTAISDPWATFVVGDHLGFDDETRRALSLSRARTVRVGPASLHAEDAIAVLWNEIDRLASVVKRP